jgi:tRNA(fMet)-specific endonuclease VapC
MAGEIALDSNIVIGYLNGNTAIVARVNSYSTIILPLTVVGELLFGAGNSARALVNLARYQQFIAQCQVFHMTSQTAIYYAETRLALKQKGRPIPENDIWIAAQCLERNWILMTQDKHFTFIDGLMIDALV